MKGRGPVQNCQGLTGCIHAPGWQEMGAACVKAVAGSDRILFDKWSGYRSSELIVILLLLGNISYVEYTVERIPHMEIGQIVLDKKLLHAADQAAKRTRRNRSALVRDALREHLRRLELRASEERDREGYSRQSQADADVQSWESEATWPEE